MKHIPLFLTLLLILAWGYTSWNWYSCNIKGFCSEGKMSWSPVSKNDDTSLSYTDVTSQNTNTSEINEDQGEELNSTLGNGSFDTTISPNLSVEDVLTLTSNPENQSEDITLKENIEQQQIETNTGTTIKSEENEGSERNSIQEDINLCENPLIGPVGLERNNAEKDILWLENFLVSQGEDITIDRVYGQDDFEAVKRFQIQYREKILDPWDITEPTGYVFRTTVQTMNEIACQ